MCVCVQMGTSRTTVDVFDNYLNARTHFFSSVGFSSVNMIVFIIIFSIFLIWFLCFFLLAALFFFLAK